MLSQACNHGTFGKQASVLWRELISLETKHKKCSATTFSNSRRKALYFNFISSVSMPLSGHGCDLLSKSQSQLSCPWMHAGDVDWCRKLVACLSPHMAKSHHLLDVKAIWKPKQRAFHHLADQSRWQGLVDKFSEKLVSQGVLGYGLT